jgi:hypothetical protein
MKHVVRGLFVAALAFVAFVIVLACFAFVANASTTAVQISNGGTGTTTAPGYGKVLVGDANGNYELTATSSLGFPVGGSGTVTSVVAGAGLSGGTITTTGTISLNLANANSWTGLATFNNATSTLFTATTGWIGTLNLTNALSVANGGTGATSLTGLITTADLASANISQFTNNSGYITSAVTSVSGTTNQITSSGGNTPTLSLPALVIFPTAASSTRFSDYGPTYFGATATSTFDTAGNLNLASGDAYSIGGASVLNATTLGSAVTGSSLTSVGTLTSGTWNATTIAIAHGGTGQTSQQAALNALAPTPTRAGDIVYYNGSNWTNLAGNNSGTQVLQETSSGVPSWASAGGTGTVTSVAASVPSIFSISGSPITTSGTLTMTYSGTALPIANGGTNETSFGTSNGIIAYNGTGLVNFASYTLTASLLTATNASTTNLTVNSTNIEGDGSASDYITPTRAISASYATTTTWTGSTTVLDIGIAPFGLTINTARCHTDTGTLNVQLQYGTGPTKPAMLSASSTIGTQSLASSNTPAKGNDIEIVFGTPASSPTQVNCTFSGPQTSV